jgi:hypothetical protein
MTPSSKLKKVTKKLKINWVSNSLTDIILSSITMIHSRVKSLIRRKLTLRRNKNVWKKKVKPRRRSMHSWKRLMKKGEPGRKGSEKKGSKNRHK